MMQLSIPYLRLVTKRTYEMEMFRRASIKLGLDQAVLQRMRSQSGEAMIQPGTTERAGGVCVFGSIMIEHSSPCIKRTSSI